MILSLRSWFLIAPALFLIFMVPGQRVEAQPCSGVWAECPDYDKLFYGWDGQDGRLLLGVPISHFDEKEPPASIPDEFSEAYQSHYNDFWGAVRRVRERGLSGSCVPSGSETQYAKNLSSSGSRPSETIKISTVVAVQPVAVIGQVEQVRTYWSELNGIFSMAFLRVQEVLKHPSGGEVGSLVSFLLPWGTLGVHGVTLCTAVPSNLDTGSRSNFLDETVLLAGSSFVWNENHVEVSMANIFRIVEGQALPQKRYPHFLPEPQNLSQIRAVAH